MFSFSLGSPHFVHGNFYKAIPHNSKCRYGERGAADAVPQLPERCLSRKAGIVRCCLKGIQQLANGLRTAIINCNFTFCAFYTFITGQFCIILRQYRTILSADTASEARQLLSQKRR